MVFWEMVRLSPVGEREEERTRGWTPEDFRRPWRTQGKDLSEESGPYLTCQPVSFSHLMLPKEHDLQAPCSEGT